jgi:NADPH:quinone reductase-like Zn-dependent oxidoreductase/SAM-dependent methyltransferase
VQEFDLIIASQCLHAAKDVLSTLKNLRDLINKGGRMIILETTRPLLAHGLAYGTFPDYWGDQDDQESPFLGLETWRLKFQASGFSGIDLELGDYEGNLKIVSTILTTAVEAIHDILPHSVPRPVTGGEIYIIYYSRPGSFHYGLEAELLERGVLPILTSLDECQLPSNCRVFFTVDLEFNVLADGEEEEFEKIKDMVRQASSILWITQGGMLEGYDPKSAICTGLIRMLTTENPLSRYGIFHLEPSNVASSSSITQQIADREIRLHNGDTENEFAVCNDIVHISRLIPDPDLNIRYRRQNHPLSRMEKKRLQGEIPMVADFESPGLLSSLYFKQDEAPHTPLADDWVEVRTSAIGLNWKDIAVSAGRLDMQHFSSECSGVVTKCGRNVQNLRTGDRVYALAWGKFGNFVRFPASFAQLMEPNYSFSEMASIPIVLCTAVYALRHLARLQKGERVLIQSATGGLGLAAVQIANDIGAEIFATVGTEEKRRYLCDLYRIPEDRIISSRDVGEVEKLMSATENTGFNVILSSANGNIMHETWRCLAPRGRFIDVGRVDVQNHSTMAMEIFQRNATFSSFDLSIMATQDPEFCGR